MSIICFQDGAAVQTSSNVFSECMIHTQIPNLIPQNILSSRCVEFFSIFKETFSCIGIQIGICVSMGKLLDFRVDTRICFILCSKMQVMFFKLILFVIVDTRTILFIAMLIYLTQTSIFVRLVIEPFDF